MKLTLKDIGITVIFYFFLICASCICLVPCFLLSLLPESIRYNKVYYFFMALFYSISLRGLWIPIVYKGKENIPSNSALYVVNHQSALDVLLVGSLLRAKRHCWFFKIELSKIPLFGYMLKRMNVPIDRSTPRKALAGLLEGIRKAREHSESLIIFPEGGRYCDGKIHDFLLGFAIIARKTGKPVVPVLVSQVYKVYPMGSFFLRSHPLRVTIGNQFFIEPTETDEEFSTRVRSWFVKHGEE
jgi:1-acyl-sn-glycerol-3-phosphate acyltransferase